MILTCPNCKSKYFVKDEIVGVSGTDVTCPTCAHQWFQRPNSATMQPIQRKRADQVYIDLQLARQAAMIKKGQRYIWAGLTGLVLLMVSLAYSQRNALVTHWGEASSVYWAMGLKVNRYGVEWVGLEQNRVFDGTRPIVEVFGVIKNMTTDERALPLVALHLNDEHGDTIEIRYADFPYTTLKPSERMRLSFQIENPPGESTEVELRFTATQPAFDVDVIRMEDVTP